MNSSKKEMHALKPELNERLPEARETIGALTSGKYETEFSLLQLPHCFLLDNIKFSVPQLHLE